MINFFTEGVLSRYWRLAYVGFTFLIALLYDFFFWELELGLGFFIFVSLYLFGFTLLAWLTKQLRQKHALLLTIPILILSFDVLLYQNLAVTQIAPWIVLLLAFVYSMLLTLQNPNGYKFSFMRIPFLHSIDLPFTKLGMVWRDLFKWKGEQKSEKAKHIILGIVIALPILLIFALLFSIADEVFSDLLTDFFDVDVDQTLWWRMFRTVLMTFGFSSIFYVFVSKNHILGNKEERVMKLNNTIVSTILTLINGLFLVFVLIQFRYLFGGAEYIFAEGLTFADYARNGFFQLVWVIVLASFLLILFYRSSAKHGSNVFLKILKVLLIAQVAVVAVSALYRMNLYQDAYGFTVKRLYVEWFIYYALAILGLAGVSLLVKWPFRRFFYTTMIGTVIAFTGIASLNVDYIIANQNVQRVMGSLETPDIESIDINYLTELSPDVIPAVIPLLGGSTYDALSRTQKDDLENLFLRYGNTLKERSDWREVHIGLSTTRGEVDSLSGEVSEYLRRIVEYQAVLEVFRGEEQAHCYLGQFRSLHGARPTKCFEKVVGDNGYIVGHRSHSPANGNVTSFMTVHQFDARTRSLQTGPPFESIVNSPESSDKIFLKSGVFIVGDRDQQVVRYYVIAKTDDGFELQSGEVTEDNYKDLIEGDYL